MIVSQRAEKICPPILPDKQTETGDDGSETLQGVFLGGDSDMKEYWDTGTFKITFDGK